MINPGVPSTRVFVPDGLPAAQALARTTHLGIGAHQDDLELMAVDGILSCYQQSDRWFTGVVMTDGRGSLRSGAFSGYSGEEIQAIRDAEQEKAAVLGGYGALVLLGFPSQEVKDVDNLAPVEALVTILKAALPEVVYIHNLADSHDTHVGTALMALMAMRCLPRRERPRKCYGVEIWRDLDWLGDEDKVVFDVSAQQDLQATLLGVYESQMASGKRYDLAAMGRRRANATYYTARGSDRAEGLIYGMDLTAVVEDESLDIAEYVRGYIERFAANVLGKLT